MKLKNETSKTTAGRTQEVLTLIERGAKVWLSALLSLSWAVCSASPAQSIGLASPHAVRPVHPAPQVRRVARPAAVRRNFAGAASARATTYRVRGGKAALSGRGSVRGCRVRGRKNAPVRRAASAPRAIPPQTLADKMAARTIAPGVIHKYYRGALTINLLDVDMVNSDVKVRPMLAGNDFHQLKDVTDHARESRAIAAVNANYFKSNGTPLGTLIIDGEWVAGPLFDRVSMGFTRDGYVRIDRVNLFGIMRSSNPEVPTAWINNINQPRRTGSRFVAYTRRWGSFVQLPYDGVLVAIDAQGNVTDTNPRSMGIPWGGYVLSDSKNGAISKLRRGDNVSIAWQTRPSAWSDVVNAVSGGPTLVKNGKVQLDLHQQHFTKRWTGAQIHARTAAGVTADNHLLLVTVEGPHTMWDLAKFLRDMGAVEALNLDGGGSTTMVVDGKAVTRGAKSSQRRVASSIVLVDERIASQSYHPYNGWYKPQSDISDFLMPAKDVMSRLSVNSETLSPLGRDYADFGFQEDFSESLLENSALQPELEHDSNVGLKSLDKQLESGVLQATHGVSTGPERAPEAVPTSRHETRGLFKMPFKNPFNLNLNFLGRKRG
ncbi:MAG: phosphodiester glycosidase family protein [Candidatus Melainabacteria bacterium]|nr:phosphodiester glycosidase family protein [Candidatus Melainabacteria bacterium]